VVLAQDPSLPVEGALVEVSSLFIFTGVKHFRVVKVQPVVAELVGALDQRQGGAWFTAGLQVFTCLSEQPHHIGGNWLEESV
jgi:hypothetical protein